MSVIEAFFTALKSGDPDRVLPMIAEDAIIVGVRGKADPRLPIYGTYRGREGMRAFLGELRKAFDTEAFEVDEMLESEALGFASGRFRHRVRHTGRLFVSTWALRAKLADGKIAHYLFFEDTAALEAAFGVSTAEEAA
ncbi:nuclear transport factor 2 family protein [Stappia sp. MMSF_3263]|uniref:nuclear transport factor 2 family protein n=1 Tax=Stappia sp. MMSF_3263 TaxID=3046693 RepID=UPI00273FE3CF|nr:nuclear transport factor 2 family protein [Stappia sp. MMSF_3263]